MARVIAAFVVSPAVVPVGVIVWALANNVPFRESMVLGSIYAAFTYGAAIFLGIPAFWAFLRRGWTEWWQYAVGGAVIALAVLAGFSAAAAESFFRLPAALFLIAIGVLTTSVFWTIGIARWRQPRGLAGQ